MTANLSQRKTNAYRLVGDIVYLILPAQEGIVEAKIDAEDLQKALEAGFWCFNYVNKNHRYATAMSRSPIKNRARISLHRVVMNANRRGDLLVDHINGDTLDNRKTNLRMVNASENTKNNWRKRIINCSQCHICSVHEEPLRRLS